MRGISDKRLKWILEKHSPQAKAQPLLLLNKKMNDCFRALSKARRSKGNAQDKEGRIRKALEDLYDELQYVAEPAIITPMETAIILNLIRGEVFDLGINLKMFKEKENQDFYFDFENTVDNLIARIPLNHIVRAKKITNHIRILKFLPRIQSEVAHHENISKGQQFKWTALILGLVFSVLISIGVGNFQLFIPGVFVSIAAYLFVSILTKKNDTADAPGGFKKTLTYLSNRSRRAVRLNCQCILEDTLRENKWRVPTTLSQTQMLKPKCDNKILELADPNTYIEMPKALETAEATVDA